MQAIAVPPATCVLSIIIVNWNTRELLAQCLQSLYCTITTVPFEVIVLDNASTDGSAEMVAARFPQAQLIRSETNTGFAGGNNIALSRATGEYILLFNPDAVAQEAAIDRLVSVLTHTPSLGVVGAQLFNPDASQQESWGVFPSLLTELPTLRRLAGGRPRPLPESAGPHGSRLGLLAVDWVSGAALMTRRMIMEQIGTLDEGYWLYTEEADWCYRAHRAGWQIALVPDAHVIHIRRAASRQNYIKSTIHFHRSRLRFIQKHRGAVSSTLARGVLALKSLVWILAPDISALARAFPDLSRAEVRRANVRILRLR